MKLYKSCSRFKPRCRRFDCIRQATAGVSWYHINLFRSVATALRWEMVLRGPKADTILLLWSDWKIITRLPRLVCEQTSHSGGLRGYDIWAYCHHLTHVEPFGSFYKVKAVEKRRLAASGEAERGGRENREAEFELCEKNDSFHRFSKKRIKRGLNCWISPRNSTSPSCLAHIKRSTFHSTAKINLPHFTHTMNIYSGDPFFSSSPLSSIYTQMLWVEKKIANQSTWFGKFLTSVNSIQLI